MWKKQVGILEGDVGVVEAGLAGEGEEAKNMPEDSSATLINDDAGILTLGRQSVVVSSEDK